MPERILSRFDVPGALVRAGRFGSGLINDTFLCEFSDGGKERKYILQRINAAVFRQPELVMRNVEIVTGHIENRLRREGVDEPASVTPALVRTRSGEPFLRDEAGGFWRMFHFIEEGEVFDTVRSPDHAFEVGRALGRFQALVSDLAPETLSDTMPGFHHTPDYLLQLDEAVRADAVGRAEQARAEIEFVDRRRTLAPPLIDMMDSGRVPVRVVHNDPKVNNVLVNRRTGEAVCMVDLDTVKPGIVHFDFGDCVRSAANPSGEDAEDLSAVRLDRELYEALVRGYLKEAGNFLTAGEIETLPLSVKVITFELGIRFLADHLRGDTYFQIGRPAHNLHRARVQFKLLENIEKEDIVPVI